MKTPFDEMHAAEACASSTGSTTTGCKRQPETMKARAAARPR
jgi:hypothetical protein